MQLKEFAIGIVIFGVCIFAYAGMIADANNNYNLDLNESEYSEVYETIDESYNLSQSMKESSVGGEIDDSEAWESMTKGSYSAVRQVITTPVSLTGSIMQTLAIKLGINPVYVKAGLVILTLAVIFAIIALFMRYKEP